MQRDVLKRNLPPGIPPAKNKTGLKSRRDYTPSSWETYFETTEDLLVKDRGTFRVYRSGNSGPVLLLLHGGGFSALTWSLFTAKVTSLSECQVLAMDMRGHGDTKTSDDLDLSTETLTTDVHELIKTIYPTEHPPIILIGHSMGGAIAIHAAANGLIPSIIGLVVIDVVEGTALEALSAMQCFLKSRPQSFESLERAIEWSVRSGQIHNVASAKVSMPGQLVKCKITEGDSDRESSIICNPPSHSGLSVISEGETSDTSSPDKMEENDNCSKDKEVSKYSWRINLAETEKYWKGWFHDMSMLFLSCPVPKVLLLAGRDRLDKQLTIGQIQGKFQLQLLPKCGHAVHEDDPDKVAEILTAFMTRHQFAKAKELYEKHVPCC